MCFSATASFVASGGLAVLGAESLRLANSKQRAIAVIPLMFAVQQAFEGFQWLSAAIGEVNSFAAYGFVIIALLVWPIYIPLTVYVLDKQRRNVLAWTLGIGFALALYYFVLLLLEPIQVHVLRHGIYYQVPMLFGQITGMIYFLAICGALLASSKREFRFFGVAIFASVMIAAMFFATTFASIWCFFAALLSSLIYLYIRKDSKKKRR